MRAQCGRHVPCQPTPPRDLIKRAERKLMDEAEAEAQPNSGTYLVGI